MQALWVPWYATPMYIVQVTPISKGGPSNLSYFSSDNIPVGALVHVPVRKQHIPALVLSCDDAKTVKSLLRSNSYETRKIEKQEIQWVFSREFVEAAKKTATYFATSPGTIIQSYVPAAILAGAKEGILSPVSAPPKKPAKFEKLVLQLPRTERFEKYKMIIRSNFAQGHSVFICAPTVREARSFKEHYDKGIEQYTFLLESSQSKKKQQTTWNEILDEKHPVLIIATPTFSSIPRSDIGMFILEHETSSSYKQMMRPKVNARVMFEYLAREMQVALVYAGTTVSLDVHKQLQDAFAAPLDQQSRNLRSKSSIRIIDSKEVRTIAKQRKKEFPVLSPEVLTALLQSSTSNEHSFVFAPRRGIASHTVCNDCNTSVVCAHCASPVVLHERGEKRELLCHRCGSSRDAHETCSNCTGWNLIPLGIGIERIVLYLKDKLPQAKLFVLSSDTAKTPPQAKKIADEFYATPGAILVGTEMAMSYLQSDVTNSVISSLDSLLCIPDFHIEEHIFGIIATLREQTTSTLFIETLLIKNSMLKHAQNGSLTQYAEEELQLRKKLNYPPYTNLIKVTCSGTRATVIKDMQTFIELTDAYKPRVFAGFIPRGGNLELHALIRLPINAWPDTHLVEILRSLPPAFSVDIDPERTL